MKYRMIMLLLLGAFAANVAHAQQGHDAAGEANEPAPKQPVSPSESDAQDGQANLVNNPLYENWARFGVGSFIEQRIVTQSGESEDQVRVTARLLLESVDKERLMLKLSRDVVMATGGERDRVNQPDEQVEVPRLVTQKEADEYINPPGMTEQGDDTITVLGKKLKTHWYEIKREDVTGEVVTRVWTNPHVPGLLAKMTIKSEGLLAFTTEMSITDIQIKESRHDIFDDE